MNELKNRGCKDNLIAVVDRPEGPSRGDHRRLSANDRPDLHRALDPSFARIRLLEGSKAGSPGTCHSLLRLSRGRAPHHLYDGCFEALNSKLRRAVRTRGHFPGHNAAMKLLYLVLNNAAEEWYRPPREWVEAKTQLAAVFGERFFN